MLEHLNPLPVRPARVVVVGAAGFVGAALVRRLKTLNIEVLQLGRQHIDLLGANAAAELAAMLRLTDSVVAVAAMAPCKNAAMLADNMRLALAMVNALQHPVAHVVNISSDAVYADFAVPMTEASAAAPESLHGVMHLARELMFHSEVKSPLAILRPTLIYGAGDPHNGYGPNRFRRLAEKGEPITLFGEGEERRDHVHVEDVAEITARVLVHRSRGVLNVASGDVHSFRSVAEKVVALSGKGSVIQGSPRQGPMPHNGYRAFDVTAIHRAFPDFDITPLESGLALARESR
jgi:nucleoside-diphosphate-sugar epimerase